MKTIHTIPKKFYLYQKERFPVLILAISLFPAILSSAAILNVNSLPTTIITLIACISYLLHIRIIDEHRDFEHDNTHHTNRPIQTGVISKRELIIVNLVSIVFILAIATFAGLHSFGLALLMLIYSYFAGKEFFLGEKIRKYFFFYNTINIVQMILMQCFVYSVFGWDFQFNIIIGTHFLFITTGTIIFEFIRKLKIPGDDGTGMDTYTWHLGFTPSLAVFSVLALSNFLLFSKIVLLVSDQAFAYLILSVFLATLLMFLIFIHWLKRSKQTDQILQLSFLLSYGILNLIIYFIIF